MTDVDPKDLEGIEDFDERDSVEVEAGLPEDSFNDKEADWEAEH